MVSPRLRSRSLKRVQVRTPGGNTVTHYRRDTRVRARCGRCGSVLNGVPRNRRDLRALPKSSKRPNRLFGGVLCHRCLEEILKDSIRNSGL